MSIRTTKKEIEKNYKNKICVPYGDLQYLLCFKSPEFYTSGVYGWNADIYQYNYNTVIVTGYRPFGNIVKYEIVKKYEDKAKKIIFNKNISCTKQKNIISELLENFINEVLKNEDRNIGK